MSGKLAENNYVGMVYAVPAHPLGANRRVVQALRFLLRRVLANRHNLRPTMARTSYAGCETGFNRGTLPTERSLWWPEVSSRKDATAFAGF